MAKSNKGTVDICRHHVRGTCRLGPACRFRHVDAAGADLADSTPRKRPRKWCRFALRGRCTFGPGGQACAYMHVDEWLQMDASERLAMPMPPMLQPCPSNMRRDMHCMLVDAWVRGIVSYDDAREMLVGLGFDLVESEPLHVAVHRRLDVIIDSVVDDIALLCSSEAAIAALLWVLDAAPEYTQEPERVEPARSGPSEVQILVDLQVHGWLPMPPARCPLLTVSWTRLSRVLGDGAGMVSPEGGTGGGGGLVSLPFSSMPSGQSRSLPPAQPMQPLPPTRGPEHQQQAAVENLPPSRSYPMGGAGNLGPAPPVWFN
eukprot:Hpha_TRINITY_DN16540_c0_g9::TRINITY_DN16540_c0_g9_i1::g.134987::m.134987